MGTTDIGEYTYCGAYDAVEALHLMRLRYTCLYEGYICMLVYLPHREGYAYL